jgi:hypothetical protein
MGGQLRYTIVACECVHARLGRGALMLLQVISVLGALMVLSAYGLIQGGVWSELNAGYLALNIVGSLLLGIVAVEDQRVGFIFLEFAWAGLGLVGVARAVKARRIARLHCL